MINVLLNLAENVPAVASTAAYLYCRITLSFFPAMTLRSYSSAGGAPAGGKTPALARRRCACELTKHPPSADGHNPCELTKHPPLRGHPLY